MTQIFTCVTMWLVPPRGLQLDWSKPVTRVLLIPISSNSTENLRPLPCFRFAEIFASRALIPGKISSVHCLANGSHPSDLLPLLLLYAPLSWSLNCIFSPWNRRSRRLGLGFWRFFSKDPISICAFSKVMRSVWWQKDGSRFVFSLFRSSASFSTYALPIRWDHCFSLLFWRNLHSFFASNTEIRSYFQLFYESFDEAFEGRWIASGKEDYNGKISYPSCSYCVLLV